MSGAKTMPDGQPSMGEKPFWSDDFDMDLPKIIPDALDLLGDVAEWELWTTGHPDRRYGNLNHPDVWNGDDAMLAYFGFHGPRKPPHCVGSDGQVRCSVWEAFRDAWPHHYLMLVEFKPIWNTFVLSQSFDEIMWDLRGWREQSGVASAARHKVRQSITTAADRLREFAADQLA